jgi:hypothetical protein
MPDPTVPTARDVVLDPGWLTDALHAVLDGGRVVAAEEVDASQTLAQKVRFWVRVEHLDGAHETRALCVKAHLDGSSGLDLTTEAQFYDELAPGLDVRKPRAYYAAVDEPAQQAIIVMDDVVASGGRFLNAHEPYSLATTRDSLGQLARLHASTWGANGLDRDWLAPRVGAMADLFPTDVLQTLLDDGRGPDVAPELRDAELVAEATRRTGTHPLTCLIHGDTQSGNVYLDAEGRACWLDWQLVQRGNWATDVAYHVATVLDIEDRRAHEADLLRHYLRELGASGAPAPEWDEAWDLYTRSFAYGYFLWAITRVSSRAIVLIHFPRLAAALTDHDTYRRLGVV